MTEKELEEILTSNTYSTQGTLSKEEASILDKKLTTKDGKYQILVKEIWSEILEYGFEQSIPYTGKGYLFIYDGTLGEEGSSGANVCMDVTGGWEASTFDWRADGDDWTFVEPTITYEKNYIQFAVPLGNMAYTGSAYTRNKINFADYQEIWINMESKKVSRGWASVGFCNDKTIKDTLGGYWYLMSDEYGYSDAVTYSKRKSIRIDSLEFMPNYAFSGMYHDRTTEAGFTKLYEYFIVKDDNWKDWLKFANINEEDYNDLNSVITNVSCMDALMKNEKAVQYMLSCSGTIMVHIIENETVWNFIPDNIKMQMKQNSDWLKFMNMMGRN